MHEYPFVFSIFHFSHFVLCAGKWKRIYDLRFKFCAAILNLCPVSCAFYPMLLLHAYGIRHTITNPNTKIYKWKFPLNPSAFSPLPLAKLWHVAWSVDLTKCIKWKTGSVIWTIGNFQQTTMKLIIVGIVLRLRLQYHFHSSNK